MRNALDRVPQRWLLVSSGVALGLITLALAWVAYRAMFSMFDVPDDDGYLLMSLRKFNAGGSLYTDVYSQYGPGVFVLVGSALRAIGLALTNDGARAINLTLWLASTLLVGLSLLRLTRRLLVSAAGLLVAFLLLKADANEPLHPGATIGFLLVAIVAAAAFLLPSRPRAALAAIGALGAALLSIKVNVGGFALLSAGFACVVTIPVLRHRLWLRVLASGLLAAIPFVLLSDHLDDAATVRFAGIVAIGVICVVVTAARLPEASVPDGRGVAALIAGAVAVVALVSLVPMIGGTSPHELIEGWVIRPSKTPGIQWDPLHVHPLSWVVAGAGLALAVTVQLLSGRTLEPRWHAVLGAGRILAGLAIWVAVTGPVFHLPIHLTQGMVVGASLLWMAMLDPRGGSPQTSFLRVLIPALAALEFLQAYPIAGSQVFWSSLLLVIVAGIIVADGADQLVTAGASWRPRFAAWPALAAIPVALFIVWFCLKPLRAEVRRASDAYDAGVALDLPGARDIRVSEPLALQLEELTAAIRRHCDTFLTIPGMNSLNIFSGEEPPVEMPGPWPFFIDADEQQKIVDEVRKIPRFCVVSKPDLLEFWADDSGNVVPDRPLVRYMRDGFRVQRNFSGYYLLVRRGEG